MELTAENFNENVLQSDKPVLVDFFAPWCGPCKVMSPIIDELEGELEGITMAKVNVDDHPALAQQYNVRSIPTFAIFKGGEVVESFGGSMTKEDFVARLTPHIG